MAGTAQPVGDKSQKPRSPATSLWLSYQATKHSIEGSSIEGSVQGSSIEGSIEGSGGDSIEGNRGDSIEGSVEGSGGDSLCCDGSIDEKKIINYNRKGKIKIID